MAHATVEWEGCRFPDGLFMIKIPHTWGSQATAHYETPFSDTVRPRGHFAAQSYVCVEDENSGQGIAVFNRGTPGYWVDDEALYLVLLRVFTQYTGYRDRGQGHGQDPSAMTNKQPLDDYRGSMTQTERAREQTMHRVELAVMPYFNGWRNADVARKGWAFNRPVMWTKFSGGHRGTANRPSPLVRVSGLPVVTDALKPAQAERAVILRLHEPYGVGGEVTLHLRDDVKRVMPVDMRERPIGPLRAQRSIVCFLQPYEIQSWQLLLDEEKREREQEE
jgi:alpha-mannosidase